MNAKYLAILMTGSAFFVVGCVGGGDIEMRSVDNVSTVQPQDIDEALNRGRAMLSARQYGLAIDAYRFVVRRDAQNAEAYSGLAIAYDNIGRKDVARRNFELALANANGDPKYNRNFAFFLNKQGQHSLAKDVMDMLGQYQVATLRGPSEYEAAELPTPLPAPLEMSIAKELKLSQVKPVYKLGIGTGPPQPSGSRAEISIASMTIVEFKEQLSLGRENLDIFANEIGLTAKEGFSQDITPIFSETIIVAKPTVTKARYTSVKGPVLTRQNLNEVLLDFDGEIPVPSREHTRRIAVLATSIGRKRDRKMVSADEAEFWEFITKMEVRYYTERALQNAQDTYAWQQKEPKGDRFVKPAFTYKPRVQNCSA